MRNLRTRHSLLSSAANKKSAQRKELFAIEKKIQAALKDAKDLAFYAENIFRVANCNQSGEGV